jgi:hypothetical protein
VSLKRLSTEIKRIEDTKGVIKRYQVDDISMNILDAYQGDNILYSGLKVLQGTISTHAKKCRDNLYNVAHINNNVYHLELFFSNGIYQTCKKSSFTI